MLQKIKNYYHLLEAILANVRYGFPSRRLTVIGVTGTDGKTTTTSLIYHILRTARKRVSMITSVGAYIGDHVYDIGFHVTTPSPWGLQQYLKRAADAGNEYAVLEVTSHALDQFRVWGIEYRVSVLTNITHEHLDYHKTYEDYAGTKLKIFNSSDICVVNKDDESYRFIGDALSGKHVVTYAQKQHADITPTSFPFKTKLLGAFNVSNCLAAAAATRHLGISEFDIKKALATFTPPPGRQEVVYNKDFLAMIDFAHTPNAFAKLLPELSRKKSGLPAGRQGRLIHVFGSAGLRDFTKRPKMGEESSHFADVIILTSEDPRTESISDINAAIKEGIPGAFVEKDFRSYRVSKKETKLLFDIHDRKTAIAFAVNIVRKGDIVVFTGKSHEKSMNYGRGEEPWDEFAEVKKALGNRH